MRSVHKRVAYRRLLGAAAAGAILAGVGIAYADDAHAAPACQSQPWGFLGSQTRTICDGPVQKDGSWMRTRAFTWPSRYVSGWCSRYYCTAGYWTEAGGVKETYPVTPDTVLSDEPGHLEGISA